MQLAVFVLLLGAFTAYPTVALVRRLHGRRMRPVSRWAPLVAGAGFAATIGLLGYLFYLMAAGRSPDPGPILAGRPLPWLALQGLAVVTVTAAIGTALAWRRAAANLPQGERIRLGLLLTAGTVFLPWAFYWGLLLP